MPPKERKQSFLATGEQREAWCFLYEIRVGLKGEPYRLPSFMVSWENVARLMQPAYNEKFLLRIGDFATERQQLLSLRVLFLCRLGKDTKVPSLERLFPHLVSSMKEPEGLISANWAAHS